ncbi:MAG: HepT-like ribonuclease domain-containing protein [FCB group bacterium]|jgi:uncharacterized protein with HEPN domain
MKQKRLYIDFLIDIYQQTLLIKQFLIGSTFLDFQEDFKLFYAICRTLEIIGEATKNIPKEIFVKFPEVKWKEMAKLRDLIIHHYQGLQEEIIWNICKKDINPLRKQVKSIINETLKSIDNAELLKLLKLKIKVIEDKFK